jgi:hypothetical protein
VQLIPEIAKDVAELTVYQRTPIWVAQRPTATIPDRLKKLYARVPSTQRIVRTCDTNFPAFEVIGGDGKDLGKFWREQKFQAYEGVAIPRFPNFTSRSTVLTPTRACRTSRRSNHR